MIDFLSCLFELYRFEYFSGLTSTITLSWRYLAEFCDAVITPLGFQLNLYLSGLLAESGAGRPPQTLRKLVRVPPLSWISSISFMALKGHNETRSAAMILDWQKSYLMWSRPGSNPTSFRIMIPASSALKNDNHDMRSMN